MTTRFSRRTALKLLGTTAAGASLPWLRTPSAFAAEGDIPLRIVFFEALDGCRRGSWEPELPSRALVPQTEVVTDWQFRDVMSPLNAYRERTTLFDNLDMVTARIDEISPSNAHIGGLTHMLTAAGRMNASLGGGISIDQLIAQRLKEQGAGTRLASLELLVTEDASDYRTSDQRQSYTAPGVRPPYISHVPTAYDRVFPDGFSPKSTGSSQPSAVETARVRRKTSIYNLVRGDYDRLLGRLGAADRERIEQMRAYREDLLKSATVIVSADRAANGVDRESILAPYEKLNGAREASESRPTWTEQNKLMARIMAAALHSDATRCGAISLPEIPDYLFGYTNGQFGSSDAHDLTHMVSGDNGNSNTDARAMIDLQHKVMYEQIAFFLDELAGLTEVDGSSLLEHTLVVVVSHIADGSHDGTRLPYLVIGDAHGYFKMGQYVRFPVVDRYNGQITTNAKKDRQYGLFGRSHGDLYTTLANAMGVKIDSFGMKTPTSQGIISEMLV